MNVEELEAIRNQYSNICLLTNSIGSDGNMSSGYKDGDYYKEGGLIGDVFGFAACEIHRALIGITADEIVVAVKGTDGGKDGVNDFLIRFEEFYNMEGKYMGKVHMGFCAAMINLNKSGLENKLEELIRQYPEKRICFTGHSKGGAVAVLFAAYFSKYMGKIHVNSFEGPRAGDETFAEQYNACHMKTLRYEAYWDLVPHVPFSEGENILLGRMGPFCDIMIEIVKAYGMYLGNSKEDSFKSVGDRVGFFVSHAEYEDMYPHNEGNSHSESLNSMCAVENLLRDCDKSEVFNTIQEIHNNDYIADKVEYVDINNI